VYCAEETDERLRRNKYPTDPKTFSLHKERPKLIEADASVSLRLDVEVG
jgi:hypothetical protein